MDVRFIILKKNNASGERKKKNRPQRMSVKKNTKRERKKQIVQGRDKACLVFTAKA